jgi:hypothetical protein
MKLLDALRRRGAHRRTPRPAGSMPALTGVFVYSPGRTGGSALVSALQQHPEIVACGQWPYEERIAATVLGQAYGVTLEGIEPSLSAFKHKLGVLHSQPRERAAYRECVEQPLLAHVRGTLDAFYARVAAAQGKAARFWVEKGAVSLWLAADDINDYTRSIVLVRDPRDSVVSAAQFFDDDNPHCRGPASVPKVVRVATGSYGRSWLELGERVQALRKQRRPLLLVRYEDLVTDPARHVRAILEFVEPSLAATADAVLEAWRTPTRKHMTAKSAQASVSRWQAELPAEQRQPVEDALAEAIRLLGYR